MRFFSLSLFSFCRGVGVDSERVIVNKMQTFSFRSLILFNVIMHVFHFFFFPSTTKLISMYGSEPHAKSFESLRRKIAAIDDDRNWMMNKKLPRQVIYNVILYIVFFFFHFCFVIIFFFFFRWQKAIALQLSWWLRFNSAHIYHSMVRSANKKNEKATK